MCAYCFIGPSSETLRPPGLTNEAVPALLNSSQNIELPESTCDFVLAISRRMTPMAGALLLHLMLVAYFGLPHPVDHHVGEEPFGY